MKKLLLVLTLLFPLLSNAQIYVEPEVDFDCSIFISKERRIGSQQGMVIYNDYIICLEDGGYVNVYDFKTASPKPIAEFELASARPDNHANNASLGIETKKGASFPLLYVTNGKVGSEIEWICFVESITKKGKKFSTEIVQTIVLDGKDWDKKGWVPIFGAPSWMVDPIREELWVFSARKRTVARITKNAWENQYIATKFRIPKLSEGKEVKLDVNDILDQVVFPFETWFTQAGCAHDGKIYFGFGVGQVDDSRPSRIRVYDTDTRTITARYELQQDIPNEIEDIALYKGWLYVNTNTRPGKTPHIYKLSLPKAKPAPASPKEEILQCPEKASGVYFVRDLTAKYVSQPPKGYKPLYINGISRHGARHVDDPITYPAIYESLEKADSNNNLTDFGKATWMRLKPFKQNVYYHEGDLTQIGYRQGREMGKRMVDNYPEVFEGKPFLKVNATNVLRVSATMQSFVQGITSKRPHLEWNEIDNSRSFLKKLNPYGTKCPDKLPIDISMHDPDGPWYKKYTDFRNSKIDADAFLSRLFKDVEQVKNEYDAYELEWRFWLMASVMQGLDRQVPIWDIFTQEEILAWAEVENYKYYAQKGNEPVNFGRGPGLGSRTFRHLLEESAKDISLGRHGLNFNFGHDGSLMSMLVNLQVGTWHKSTDNPEDVLDIWQYWNIPMGSNIQMIFYKHETTDHVLVKFMLNEEDVKLPLKSIHDCFYDWEEVYDYYISHCNEVEKSLEETSTIKLQLNY